MDRTPVLAAKQGDFSLKPNSGAMPGIEKKTTAEAIEVTYQSRFALFDETENVSRPVVQEKTIKTDARIPKLGVMLVGLGGNNGSTFTAGVLANKHQLTWETKNGEVAANFFGSFTQSATTHVGFKFNEKSGELNDVFKPVNSLLPMVNPVDFDVCGWDISAANLYESCKRAHVLEPTLISQLKPELEQIKPMRAILNPDYIASN